MDDAVARSYGMTSHPSMRFGHDDLMLDDDTVDRVLDGLAADDAPPGYGWVAGALTALRAPGDVEAEGEAQALAVFRAAREEVEVIDCPPADDPVVAKLTDGRRARRLHAAAAGRARRVGVAAGVVAGLSLLSATSAAAMTGALPAPAQRAAHDVMSVVGVHVPAPTPHVVPAAPAEVHGGDVRPTVPPAITASGGGQSLAAHPAPTSGPPAHVPHRTQPDVSATPPVSATTVPASSGPAGSAAGSDGHGHHDGDGATSSPTTSVPTSSPNGSGTPDHGHGHDGGHGPH